MSIFSNKTLEPLLSSTNEFAFNFDLKSFNCESNLSKKPFTPPEDLLTLSVTHRRLRNAIPHFFEGGIIDDCLVPLITAEDRELASKIRDHYSKKIMIWRLKGIELTQFREALNQFIHGTEPITDEVIPLVFKLPEFYEYDVGFDEVRRELISLPEWSDDETEVTLLPVRHFQVKRKAQGYNEYWLKDKFGYGYRIKLPFTPVDNPLLHLWEREFAKPSIRISGHRKTFTSEDQVFYRMEKWIVV